VAAAYSLPLNDNPRQTAVEYALWYADRGWVVLPLHWPMWDSEGVVRCSCRRGQHPNPVKRCRMIGKHPLVRWAEATTDPDKIRAMWQRWPLANVGTLTGECHNRLVTDLDIDELSIAQLEELAGIGGVRTPALVSGSGGQHRIWRFPVGQDYQRRHRIDPGCR
jgi:hypothetical protein